MERQRGEKGVYGVDGGYLEIGEWRRKGRVGGMGMLASSLIDR
jgi:hypothetical protein